MKLKQFNRQTVVKGCKDKKPFLSMQTRNGVVSMSKGAATLLGVGRDDMVQIIQDEDNPTEFYIEKVDSDGFLLRSYDNHQALCFNCAEVVRAIIRSRNGSDGYQRLPIGESVELEGRTLWTIITAAIK